MIKYFGVYIFDEARSSNNHPHDHIYVRIRETWYDFSTFDHPGGPIALNLAKDRDATALFESHHLLVSPQRLFKLLSKYKVDSKVAKSLKTLDPNDDGGHYEWKGFEHDAFVCDLKELLYSYFSQIAKERKIGLYQATKATPKRWLMITSLLTAFCLTLPSFLGGCWWALFITPQLAWILVANYWHDSLHFSLSSNWKVNAIMPYFFPIISSPWMWYHQHVIGHHVYTNVAHKDPDIAHAPQLMREHNSIRWRKAHKTQGSWTRILLIWSISVVFGLHILSDLKANWKLTYNNAVPYRKLSSMRIGAHVIGRVIWIACIFIWPFYVFPRWKACVWTCYPIFSFSWSFMMNTQINHLTEECSHASNKNFLKHQVITAQNFGCQSIFCRVFSGGLNFQIEHHLFPFVNHCHLPFLAPGVKFLCKKHNIKYNETQGYFEAFQKHVTHTLEMAKDPKII